MARLDLYPRPGGAAGYLLDVQSDMLDELQTRVVVPLMPPDEVPRAIPRLHPEFRIGGEPYVMATQLLGAVPRRVLGRPVGRLPSAHDQVLGALDRLLTGL